ncbi:hypothetical protein RSAG8_09231, partial [Rhizoctonia solani AG-8 WAC10335]
MAKHTEIKNTKAPWSFIFSIIQSENFNRVFSISARYRDHPSKGRIHQGQGSRWRCECSGNSPRIRRAQTALLLSLLRTLALLIPFWELSSDKKGADSLVTISATNIGALDTTPNHLYYPYSQFDNVKNNMGAGSSGPDTTVAPSPTTTQPPATTSSPITSAPVTTATQAPGSVGCDGLSAWRSDVAYTAGNVVSYNGHKWTAKWWNQAETPGGASGAWTDNGSC